MGNTLVRPARRPDTPDQGQVRDTTTRTTRSLHGPKFHDQWKLGLARSSVTALTQLSVAPAGGGRVRSGQVPRTQNYPTVSQDLGRRGDSRGAARHRGPYVVILVAVNNWISVDVRRAGAGTRGGRPDGVEDLAAGGRQAGRGDRRDLDVPDEVDPGNHRVAHPRPQDRVAGRRRGRPGDGRDLGLPGDPCRSGARPRQCTDTKSVTTGNPGQARPGQLRRHQHRPARHPREDPAQATAVPPRTPRRISRPDRAGPPASSATTSTDPGLSHSVGGGPPGRLSRSLPGGPPEARSEAPCSR